MSWDNKVLTSNPTTLENSALPKLMFLNSLFVFVYTVIRAWAVQISLDKELNAEEKLFLHKESCICISLNWCDELT